MEKGVHISLGEQLEFFQKYLGLDKEEKCPGELGSRNKRVLGGKKYYYVQSAVQIKVSRILSMPYRSSSFPGSSDGKESACNEGDPGSIPGSGRSPGEGNGNPLQHSFLENPTDRRAWQAAAHGVAKSQTRPSSWHTSKLSTTRASGREE